MTELIDKYYHARIPFLFIFDFEMNEPVVLPVEEIDHEEILFECNGFRNYAQAASVKKKITLKKYPVSYQEYLHKFNLVRKHIQEGNTYLLNLTFETPVQISAGLREIFYASSAPFKLYYKDHFVVFSPERFIKIHKNRISTWPMKGTIDASEYNAKEKILNDKKEAAEHATITDLLRNDLSRVASNVTVNRYRYIDEVPTGEKTLLQVSSEITGVLLPDMRKKPGEVIAALLPAGSVTGAPKNKTLGIIKETENYTRGYYTGVFGCYDGMTIDSAVMIRYIEKRDNQLFYKSGGGITSQSAPEKEYREYIQKIYVPVH